MRDIMRKGDYKHSNEQSNGSINNEEENQLSMYVRKDDAEKLNEKGEKTLMKRKTLEYASVGEKVELINTMRN